MTHSNYPITDDELRNLQIGVLNAIDTFCKERGITYSLACGTLLGAIRHKGYIPWDDDIDIYLLRDNYNRLMMEFPNVYDNYFKLISLERNDLWDRPYAKAFDDRTIVEENAVNSVKIGVNIDIYPIDDVPNDEQKWFSYNRKRRLFQRLYASKTIKLGGRSVLKDLILLILKFFLIFVSRRQFAEFLSSYAQKYNEKNYEYVFENVQGMLQKNRFKKCLFLSVVDAPFNGHSFSIFRDYDDYLRNAYGDYMQLPPENKRVTHHDFDAFWK